MVALSSVKHRSPIFSNPGEPKRRLELLLDLEEVIRYIRERYDDQVVRFSKRRLDLGSRAVVQFKRDQLIDVLWKGHATHEAQWRRFERWKRLVRQLVPGALVDTGVDDSRWHDANASSQHWYLLDIDVVERELAEALHQSEGEASTPVGHSRHRTPRREMPIKEAFESLGVGYSQGKIRAWIELCMPVVARQRGKRKFYFVNMNEVEEWIKKAVTRGVVADPFEPKTAIEEAIPILRGVREKLNLTVSRMAGMLGVTPGRLNSYMGFGTYGKWVPTDLIHKAEGLLRTGVPQEKEAMRHGSPTLEVIRQTIAAERGNLSAASRALAAAGYTIGISSKHLGLLADKYGIPHALPWIVLPPDDDLKELLKKNRYRIYRTANELGISGHALTDHIKKRPEVAALVARYGHGKITRQDVVEAAEAAEFKTGVAAKLLDVSESRVQRLLHEHGLRDWYSARGALELPP